MKVLLLANEEQKKEFISQPVNKDFDLLWVEQPASPGTYSGINACIDLLFENKPERIDWLRQLEISAVIINSVITTLEEIGEDFIRINGWNTFLGRSVMEASCKNEEKRQRAAEVFAGLGRSTEWVPDIPGMVAPRVVVSIINEAWLALEEQVSGEDQIDIAMKLGTNYPYGPFEWGQKIGLNRVYSLLEVLGNQQNRYKPSRLLKEKTLV